MTFRLQGLCAGTRELDEKDGVMWLVSGKLRHLDEVGQLDTDCRVL